MRPDLAAYQAMQSARALAMERETFSQFAGMLATSLVVSVLATACVVAVQEWWRRRQG